MSSAQETKSAVKNYTAGWTKGDFAKVKANLAANVTFEDPVNKFNSSDSLIEGLNGFRQIFKGETILAEVYEGDLGFILYDCKLATPSGKLRCAEYFKVKGGKITEIKLVFDATELNKLAQK